MTNSSLKAGTIIETLSILLEVSTGLVLFFIVFIIENNKRAI
jgi:hypothetical protein